MQIDYVLADTGDRPGWNLHSHLDLSQPETRMYYYYLSTRYIDAGCENIHFGDLHFGCRKDTGNRHLWNLTKLIREYAASIDDKTGKPHARRGVVLLETHPKCDLEDKYKDKYLYGWYHDPEDDHLPDWRRQLIFDFNMFGTYYRRNKKRVWDCSDNYFGLDQESILPVILKDGYGLINHSVGGLHPMGWLCMHLPVLNRFDSGSIDPDAGCSEIPPTDTPWHHDCYGYDNASWFGRQKDREKEQILLYTWYKIKCLDPYGYFGMPAILPVRWHIDKQSKPPNYDVEDTEMNFLPLSPTIKNIWSGVFDEPNFKWLHHNFTFENVANPFDVPPASNLVFVGSDKMYFIGQDGCIHGYIKVNGDFNGGTWLTVSPTYACDFWFLCRHGLRATL
jgi:hypothetical protein